MGKAPAIVGAETRHFPSARANVDLRRGCDANQAPRSGRDASTYVEFRDGREALPNRSEET